MDNIFMKYSNTTEPAEQLKALFGLDGVEYVYRFTRIVTFDLESGKSASTPPRDAVPEATR